MEIWILRAIVLGAITVMFWSLVTGHLNLGLALLLSIVATVTGAGAGMTPAQRRQMLGQNLPMIPNHNDPNRNDPDHID